jgi:nitroreductase
LHLEDGMELFEAIRGRKSVRRYQKGDLASEDLRRILEAAICAPSAGNRQSWDFVVAKENQTKAALAEAAYGQEFIAQASAVIVVCANLARSSSRYGDRGRDLYSIQDTAAAVQNILLASYALGYGSCWIGAFDESRVAHIVNASSQTRPVAMIPIGRPAESPDSRPRLSLGEVLHTERFD